MNIFLPQHVKRPCDTKCNSANTRSINISESNGISCFGMGYMKVLNVGLQSSRLHPLAQWLVRCLGPYSSLKDEQGICKENGKLILAIAKATRWKNHIIQRAQCDTSDFGGEMLQYRTAGRSNLKWGVVGDEAGERPDHEKPCVPGWEVGTLFYKKRQRTWLLILSWDGRKGNLSLDDVEEPLL